MFLQQMNDGLFHVNEVTREVEPRLAESWEVSEDGMSITFKIRSGAKFITAILSRPAMLCIPLNLQNSPRIKTYYSAIESVEAPDDSTFIVHLKAPNATFFSTLSNHNYVVSQREMEEQVRPSALRCMPEVLVHTS